jgi:hypothetical protein
MGENECSGRGWGRGEMVSVSWGDETEEHVSPMVLTSTDCRQRRDIMLRVLGVRLLSRLLVLVCSLSLLSLLFLSRCGFNNLESDLVDTSGKFHYYSIIIYFVIAFVAYFLLPNKFIEFTKYADERISIPYLILCILIHNCYNKIYARYV